MWNDLPRTVVECCERLKEAQIEHIDAIELIRRYDSPDTLIYCDPPYLQELRKRDMYAHEFTEVQHKELLSVLLRSKSKIILSGYDSQLYNDTLKGWSTAEIETIAQMGLHRTEKIWFNFEQKAEQMCFEEVGK